MASHGNEIGYVIPLQIAWLFTNEKGYFILESRAYRVLRGFELVETPAFRVLSTADDIKHPTQQVHELWPTDFTYFKL